MSRQIPARLLEFLNQANVRYEIRHHPVAFTAQELAAIEGVKGHQHAKVVMAKAGAQLIMLVVPSDCRIDWERLSQLTGQPTGLATEADFQAIFPDCEIGTMPPFGHLYGVVTYVDRAFTVNTGIACEAGTHSDALRMDYADYERLAQPIIADFAGKANFPPRTGAEA